MAKLYIPSQSPLVRAKRGFGAPRVQPTELIRPPSFMGPGAGLWHPAIGRHNLGPSPAGGLPTSPSIIVDEYGVNLNTTAVSNFEDGASTWWKTIPDDYSQAILFREIGELTALSKLSYVANRFNIEVSINSGRINLFIFGASSLTSDNNFYTSGDLVGIAFTCNQVGQQAFFQNYTTGEFRSDSYIGGYSTTPSGATSYLGSASRDYRIYGVAIDYGTYWGAARTEQILREGFWGFVEPANQTPFLIGTAGAPPLDFDETAQIAATATVTAAETYTPPVAPSYDETAQIAASVTITANETFGTEYIETAQIAATATITALETYTPPAGTDNNVWVGADRLDALAVGATVLDQAYVGTVPVLNQ